jgi:OTU domain-containing protein 3
MVYSRKIVDSDFTANYYYDFCASCTLQLKTPRWHIRNFESVDTFTLHLSYHDGEHYNSVRRLDDDGGCRAKPISIEGDSKPSTKPPPLPKDKLNHGEWDVKSVMESTGCRNVDKVQEVSLFFF